MGTHQSNRGISLAQILSVGFRPLPQTPPCFATPGSGRSRPELLDPPSSGRAYRPTSRSAEQPCRVFRKSKMDRHSPAARREHQPQRERKPRRTGVRRRAPHGLAIALPSPIDPVAATTSGRTRSIRPHRGRSPGTCRRSTTRSRSGRRCGARGPSSCSDGEARSRSRPQRRTRW